MSDSSIIIQYARDTLDKWRTHQFNTAWEVDTNAPFSGEIVGLFAPERKAYPVRFDDDQQPDVMVARLIVGTAGNPELLDAIDLMLRAATHPKSDPRHRYDAERIAAAIVSADERMSA